MGAYTTALLTTRLGVPFWVSAPAGVVLAGVCGALLALPSLRANGPYLAMVTVAFGFMAEVTANRWSFTGGPMGIMAIPGPKLPGGAEMTPTQYFWLIGGVALACQIAANHLLTSRVGRTLLALRGSEVAAETVGINVYRWKVLAFVISSMYAGLGGVFFAHQHGFINSDTFYGRVRALDGIDVDIQEGQVDGLLGPNGSGKTTLLNVLGGLLRPTAGVVCFDGALVAGKPPWVFGRLGIGRTFQIPRPFAGLTVLDSVLVGVTLSKRRRLIRATDRRREGKRLLAIVGLDGKAGALSDDPRLARAARRGARHQLSIRVGLSTRVVCSGG